jgi:type III secretory pathway component EscU
MKKLLLFLFLLIPVTLLAQEAVNPPANWIDLFANLNTWLATLAGVAAVTVFLAGVLNTLLKTTGFVKQLVAWGVSIAILVVGNLINFGFMAQLTWLNTLIYGVAAGFLANGIFDLAFIQMILKALKIEK